MADSQLRRLIDLLNKIRDNLDRWIDSIGQAPDGRELPALELPHFPMNHGDVKAAAVYLCDLGLNCDGLRLKCGFDELLHRRMDEGLASEADGKPQEYRDWLTEKFGPFPSQGNPNDSAVASRRLTILGIALQLSEYVAELISSVTALSEPHQGARDNRQPSSPKSKPKRSTERDEGRAKLIAALTTHHKYANGSCLNMEPIGNNELARLAKVSDSTASAFFKKQFGGHKKYRVICSDATRLIAALKLLNQEFSPHHLFGAKPPGEDEREEEE